MAVRVMVDARERALAELLRGEAETGGLALGDICVTSPEGRRTVIERKSAVDLGASIRDGRWREQMGRMSAARDGTTTFMVAVEGLGPGAGDGETFGGVAVASLRSALLSAQLRDGVHVSHTADTAGTAELVRAVARKMASARPRGEDGGPESAVHLAAAALPKRGDGWSRRALAEAQLSLAPGVSRATAAALLGDADCLADWAAAARGAGGARAMADLRVGASGRRLGDRTAAKLAALLL